MELLKENLLHMAREKYPISIQYKGRLSEQELEYLDKFCDVRCFSVFMDGSAVYNIRYRTNEEGEL